MEAQDSDVYMPPDHISLMSSFPLNHAEQKYLNLSAYDSAQIVASYHPELSEWVDYLVNWEESQN